MIVDPLSVIVKLAIMASLPVGSKCGVYKHVVVIDRPGMFQSICRSARRASRSDLAFLLAPIRIACRVFLPMHRELLSPVFMRATDGIAVMRQTYADSPTARVMLAYYADIISNALALTSPSLDSSEEDSSSAWTTELIERIQTDIWTENAIRFMVHALQDIRALETMIATVDQRIYSVLVLAIPALDI